MGVGGGRARQRIIHPLTWVELKEVGFDLWRFLSRGGLPSIFFSDDPSADLQAYLDQYLDQEIAVEAQVRNLPAFSRFLEIAGLASGQILNYTRLSSNSEVKRTTVHEYYQVLTHTLLGSEVTSWSAAKKTKLTQTSIHVII